MHPRNIYKNPPDFKVLAETYPEFRKYVSLDLSGKLKFNFHCPEALSVLAKTLLLKDFNLDVDIPVDRLVPTLPLRLNYVLWMEDLLSLVDTLDPPVLGIDIGTGASAIYSLLCAKKGWKMLATEVDSGSYKIAKKNIECNDLDSSIMLKLVDSKHTLLDGAIDENSTYYFCMCNPPFFSLSEVPDKRTNRRSPPNNAPTGSPIELETDGGEIAFVTRIIEDSSVIKNQIMIYSSMIGKLSNLSVLKNKLKEVNPISITTTEFHQGRTTRWGLAWSYCLNLPLTEDSNQKKKTKDKQGLPIAVKVEKIDLDKAIELSKEVFSELKLECKETRKLPYTCHVIAVENTWSNQRRKRREMMRSNQGELTPPAKKFKTDESGKPEAILEFIYQLQKVDNHIIVKGTWVAGSSGKDGVHQILQYFKNSLVRKQNS